jgi:hypothetical protein
VPFLRKSTGGCTVLGYTWHNAGDMVEVTDAHAKILLAIADADFVEVPASTGTFSEVVNDTPVANPPIRRTTAANATNRRTR